MRRFLRLSDPVVSELLRPRARAMRGSPTASEAKLWAVLRNKGLGVRFRRQVILGPYIVDFFAPSARVVIEVDGPVHESHAEEDHARDEFLRCSGYRVLRIGSEGVMQNLGTVISTIAHALRS